MRVGRDGAGVIILCFFIRRLISVKRSVGRGDISNKRFVIVIVLCGSFGIFVDVIGFGRPA